MICRSSTGRGRPSQIAGVLVALEAGGAGRKSTFWFGDTIGHADIAVACVIPFYPRSASGRVRRGAMAGPGGACGAMRGAAAVPGDRADVFAAGGLRPESLRLRLLQPEDDGFRSNRITLRPPSPEG